MARRLILDTGVLIASERGRANLADLIAEDDDAAIAAITVAELRTGVELASDRYRAPRNAFVQRVLDVLPVEPYDLATALVHGELLGYVQRTGVTRGAHDLIVAATALATGRTVVSTDRGARFHDLPGVTCLT
ncbi:MAG TPA: PIN domain-containing protein [Jatrophihabitantaceae bacterium]